MASSKNNVLGNTFTGLPESTELTLSRMYHDNTPLTMERRTPSGQASYT